MNGYEHTANVLKALAHPVRLQILQLLGQEGEACVCHLEARLGQRQAYISQQLAKLRQAALVEDRREGLNVFYALSADGINRLIEETQKLAEHTARAEGIDLAFGSVRKIEADECLCPRCEEKLPAPAASA